MAGIGFQLRKIFTKDTLTSKVSGVIFASMSTIGPMIVFLIMLLSVNHAISVLGADEIEKLMFSCITLYIFMLCVIISGATGTVISRYISDCLHEEKTENIPPAMIGTNIMVTLIAAIPSSVCCVVLYFKYNVEISLLIGIYLLCITSTIAYNIMIFVSALKEYRRITTAFLFGAVVGFLLFALLFFVLKAGVLASVMSAMASVFLVIDVILIYLIYAFFNKSSKNYFGFLRYFRKFPHLFFSALFYVLGMYIHNIIYWFFSDLSMHFYIFRAAPSYDLAVFLALIANISAPVIFVVKIETGFFEKYSIYVRSLQKATFGAIEKNRKVMMESIDAELFYIYDVQLIITLITTCLGTLALPALGFGGIILNIFLVLSMGMYSTFMLYFTVVFLYYYDDQFGAFISCLTFFVMTALAATAAVLLGLPNYPLALLVGAISGWICSFLRLKFYLKTINSRLFR